MGAPAALPTDQVRSHAKPASDNRRQRPREGRGSSRSFAGVYTSSYRETGPETRLERTGRCSYSWANERKCPQREWRSTKYPPKHEWNALLVSVLHTALGFDR